MAKDIFRDREQAEESAYFKQKDAKLIEKLRAKAKLSEIARALGEKLSVDNPDLLRRITALGITLDTGAAFILAPLVEVAWSDGDASAAERDAVLRLAQERGVQPGSSDHAQLIKWMMDRPSDELFDVALEALRVGIGVLPPEEAEQRINTMLKACEQVAEASGGLARMLHLSTGVSAREQSVLNLIRQRLKK